MEIDGENEVGSTGSGSSTSTVPLDIREEYEGQTQDTAALCGSGLGEVVQVPLSTEAESKHMDSPLLPKTVQDQNDKVHSS